MESVTMAFLIALERLTPQQRAVLVLRDVYDYSVRETAEALGIGESNVKVTHLRARRVMEGYDASRAVPTEERRRATAEALERLVAPLAQNDLEDMRDALAEDVTTTNDAGGEFLAARNLVAGRDRVARLYHGLAQHALAPPRVELRELNGLPALVVTFDPVPPRQAPRAVMHVDVGDDGAIRAIHLVLATEKLGAIRFPS